MHVGALKLGYSQGGGLRRGFVSLLLRAATASLALPPGSFPADKAVMILAALGGAAVSRGEVRGGVGAGVDEEAAGQEAAEEEEVRLCLVLVGVVSQGAQWKQLEWSAVGQLSLAVARLHKAGYGEGSRSGGGGGGKEGESCSELGELVREIGFYLVESPEQELEGNMWAVGNILSAVSQVQAHEAGAARRAAAAAAAATAAAAPAGRLMQLKKSEVMSDLALREQLLGKMAGVLERQAALGVQEGSRLLSYLAASAAVALTAAPAYRSAACNATLMTCLCRAAARVPRAAAEGAISIQQYPSAMSCHVDIYVACIGIYVYIHISLSLLSLSSLSLHRALSLAPLSHLSLSILVLNCFRKSFIDILKWRKVVAGRCGRLNTQR